MARQILDLTRDRLIQALPFLNRAILYMPAVFYHPAAEAKATEGKSGGAGQSAARQRETSDLRYVRKEGADIGDYLQDLPAGIGTNGNFIYAAPETVILLFKENGILLARTYLHMLMHCLFQHPFQYRKLDRRLWDFAADVAAEHTALEFECSDLELPDDWDVQNSILRVKGEMGEPLTADHIYRWMQAHPERRDEMLEMAPLFHRDIHETWMLEDHLWKEMILRRGGDSVGQKWQTISSGVQQDMDSYEKNQAMAPGTLRKVFREQFRKSGGYTEFLQKFAKLTEEIHVNPDEFDYIYYTYGLSLYRNMPLIEPLEYRETSKIRDFVIALDTSGSCQGRVIRGFLHKTWSVLKESGAFSEQVNLHLIQCDSKIQKDVRISNDQEFEEYMQNIEIIGSGGTDFRPVFSYVRQLEKSGAFTHLQGLLYFTDGYGTFPVERPDYQTAFVFVRDKFEIPKVPAWAMKVVLQPDEL